MRRLDQFNRHQRIWISKVVTIEGHWDIVQKPTLTGHQFGVIALAVTPDGQRIVSASWDRTLKLWDLVSRRELRTLSGYTGLVAGVVVISDGQRAVSASGTTR